MEIREARPMTARTLPDDFRYPPASDEQIREMQDQIAEYSAGDKSVATRIDWLGSFRRLLPMYWRYRADAEYWKSWQDADKIKALETENARLLAAVQEQMAEIARLREEIRGWQDDHPFPG